MSMYRFVIKFQSLDDTIKTLEGNLNLTTVDFLTGQFYWKIPESVDEIVNNYELISLELEQH